ncbi:Hypothetical protein A7982_01940 [Minicystis rosea]|nr:Hypothetical protein A7982_01940 [Minicystis rosea]
MTSRLRFRSLVPAALVTTLVVGPALADDPPKAPAPPSTAPLATDPAQAEDASAALARAKEIKKAADRSMDALRFADAYAAYADVFAITRDPALLYNMGRALQALNRHPEALTKLEAFQAVAPPELKARVPRLDELIKDLRARVATLRVNANVPNGRVLVRSTVMSKLPVGEPLRLSAGKAEIEVEADGYFPFRATVDLPGGGETTVDAKLFSKSTTGLLSVRASAPGSLVFVDEQRVGLAPVELNVQSGTHRIKLKNPDFRDYETTTVINPGTRKDLDVRLLPPSVLTRWWFWGSIALAGATAGVITYAATTERSPSRGDIAPGQLPTPAAFKGGVTVLHF